MLNLKRKPVRTSWLHIVTKRTKYASVAYSGNNCHQTQHTSCLSKQIKPNTIRLCGFWQSDRSSKTIYWQRSPSNDYKNIDRIIVFGCLWLSKRNCPIRPYFRDLDPIFKGNLRFFGQTQSSAKQHFDLTSALMFHLPKMNELLVLTVLCIETRVVHSTLNLRSTLYVSTSWNEWNHGFRLPT